MTKTTENPLGILPEGQLLRKFAIPSIIAMLVSSLYNIVDQFFIGNTVGELGNAATNIAFPLTTSCIAIALLFGIGGASAFNLALGEGDKKRAGDYLGNAAVIMTLCGLVLAIVTSVFLKPMLLFFGSPKNVLPYAMTYTRITAIGFPFLILSAGGTHLVRADGSPNFTMFVNLIGAVINTILDAVFVFGLGWGMAGAAFATIIGQMIAASLVVWYLTRTKSVTLTADNFFPHARSAGRIASLGTAPCFNQLSLMVVHIATNNIMKYYGARSIYGESIPIACAGISIKVFQVMFAFIIGISQGQQPIVSFNYGAKKYDRVKRAYFLSLKCSACISVLSFLLFQIFPARIISLFGQGSQLYIDFAVKYFRIYFFFIFIGFIQPITSNFFTSIGKPGKGIFLSLTRQILFLLPLLIILPIFFGIDGVVYSGPIADFFAATACVIMISLELKRPEYCTSS